MTAIEFPWSSVKRPIREQGFLSPSLIAHLIPDEKGAECFLIHLAPSQLKSVLDESVYERRLDAIFFSSIPSK